MEALQKQLQVLQEQLKVKDDQIKLRDEQVSKFTVQLEEKDKAIKEKDTYIFQGLIAEQQRQQQRLQQQQQQLQQARPAGGAPGIAPVKAIAQNFGPRVGSENSSASPSTTPASTTTTTTTSKEEPKPAQLSPVEAANTWISKIEALEGENKKLSSQIESLSSLLAKFDEKPGEDGEKTHNRRASRGINKAQIVTKPLPATPPTPATTPATPAPSSPSPSPLKPASGQLALPTAMSTPVLNREKEEERIASMERQLKKALKKIDKMERAISALNEEKKRAKKKKESDGESEESSSEEEESDDEKTEDREKDKEKEVGTPKKSIDEARGEKGKRDSKDLKREEKDKKTKVSVLGLGRLKGVKTPRRDSDVTDSDDDSSSSQAHVNVHQLIEEDSLLSEIEERLKDYPGEINLKNDKHETPLMAICSKPGNPRADIVRFFLAQSGIDLQASDNHHRNALHIACAQPSGENGEIIQLLLRHGVEVKADKSGYYPLHYFVRQHPKSYFNEVYKKTLDLLLEQTPIDTHAKNGETVMHCVARYGKIDVLNLVIERKATIAAKNNSGETALQYAVLAMNNEMLGKLFDLGLDPRVGDKEGKTPLQLARGLGNQGKTVFDYVKARISNLDMKDMSKEEKVKYKRKLAIDEIVETEREYLNDLEILIKMYMNPLKKNLSDPKANKILSQEAFRKIFGNVEEIREVSVKLYKDLKKQHDKSGEDMRVGKILLKHIEALKKYKFVCTQQQDTTEFIQASLHPQGSIKKKEGSSLLTVGRKRSSQGLHTEDSEFAKFCKEVEVHPECRQMDLSSFLIKMFQRVTKYPLLVRELLSYTEEGHADYKSLVRVREELSLIIDEANEKKRETDNMYKIFEIQNSLIWETADVVRLGTDKERRYLGEGLFHCVYNEKLCKYYLFALSDMLIATQPKKDKKGKKSYLYTLRFNFPTSTTQDVAEVGHGKKFGFSIYDAESKQRMLICTDTVEQKQEWLRMINEYVTKLNKSIQSEKKSETAKWKGAMADVLYDFNGDFTNSLPLSAGEQVWVLETDKEGDGWWLGELNGKKGFFPKTHVRLQESI